MTKKNTEAANGGRPITHFITDELDFLAMDFSPEQFRELWESCKPKESKYDKICNLLFGTSEIVDNGIHMIPDKSGKDLDQLNSHYTLTRIK